LRSGRRTPAKGGKKEPTKIDFTGLEPVGKLSAVRRARFWERDGLFVREFAGGKEAVQIQDRQKRFWQRPIEREQVAKLLAVGKPICWKSSFRKTAGRFPPGWCWTTWAK